MLGGWEVRSYTSHQKHFNGLFNKRVGFQEHELACFKSFEVKWLQTYRGKVFMLDGWEVHM